MTKSQLKTCPHTCKIDKNFLQKSVGSNSSISTSGTTGTSNTEGDADDSSLQPIRRGRGHTISDMNPASRKLHARTGAASKKINTSKEAKGGISPR